MRNFNHWRKVHFLLFEGILSIILGVAFVAFQYSKNGSLAVDHLLEGNRGAIYGTLAALYGALLGFIITASSIVLGYSYNPSLALVRNSPHYPTLWQVFIETIRALSVATIASLIGLIGDRDKTPSHIIMIICVFATLYVFFRMARSVWVFERILTIVAHNKQG